MRYDTPIYFQKLTRGEYDETSGNYGDATIAETEAYADMTDSGAKTTMLYYQEIKKGSRIIRIQNHYNDPFDKIRIGDKTYKVDFSRKLRRNHVFIVSEV